MPAGEKQRLERAYTRNLGWCRFWLGVGMAIITLTFSFTVDRVFDPLFQPPPIGTDDRNSRSGGTGTVQIHANDVRIVALLLLSAVTVLMVSWRFRDQYIENDAALGRYGNDPQEEETP
jgi:hypothetical protein